MAQVPYTLKDLNTQRRWTASPLRTRFQLEARLDPTQPANTRFVFYVVGCGLQPMDQKATPAELAAARANLGVTALTHVQSSSRSRRAPYFVSITAWGRLRHVSDMQKGGAK